MAPRTLFLALANLLIPIAILVFAIGFFPYKPFMPGLASYETLAWEKKFEWKKAPEPPFDKVVFMVVDALRSDFVYGKESGFQFVQSLIRDGTALPFTAHATSPTITMPRVKAITTGSIPSFLDVILNFAESDTTSTLATQDTWLAQLKAKDNGTGKLVMYGDDTWLKLFPDFFARADGTTSFFVSDFTEVDNNVTRHVPNELLNEDWNGMIMHYLGLDHIGHKTGPTGPRMKDKQIEMDGIVRDIYSAIENEDHLANTLFVLCGDHGMTEGGNHGGSMPGETSPALVFMSPKLTKITHFKEKESPVEPKGEFEYYKKVEQSDIAPTLAGLMGFPIPRNNLGVFIEEFLHFWDDGADRIQLLIRNAEQVKKIVQATYPSLYFGNKWKRLDCGDHISPGELLACRWQGTVGIMGARMFVHPKIRVDQIYFFLRKAQETMSTTASNYDLSKLILGTSLAALSTLLSFLSLPSSLFPVTPTGLFFTLTTLLSSVQMFASSYVEEEHNFWYWATSAWFLTLFIISSRKTWFPWFIFHPALMLLLTHRVIRRWNQTGQKYAGAPDIVHSSLIAYAPSSVVLWGLIGATYLDVTVRMSQHIAKTLGTGEEVKKKRGGGDEEEGFDVNRLMGLMAVLPLGATAFVFKLAFTVNDAPELTRGIAPGLLMWAGSLELVGLARMVFIGIFGAGVWVVVSGWWRARGGKRGNGETAVALVDLLTLFLMTQTKAENIPLFLLFRMQSFFLSFILPSLPLPTTPITTLLLSQTSYFAFGASNAISSISLSNSYNGVSSYNPAVVATLVFISNWTGPIFWSAQGLLLLGGHGEKGRNFGVEELDERDWIVEERAHLIALSKRETLQKSRRKSWTPFLAHFSLLSFFLAAGTVATMGACTILRQHLFVWSVFSPKFLFAVGWVGVWGLGVNGVMGAGVWAAGML
ncbi:GPI ethanolamine phosphate transferase-like protein 2 [Dendryphion nanum]|uniref:GPI ethanolamine phosphate transferase 2 n=1 Tax=Dendryphion nanum TaxID=256645 RepID=A0A9P9II11_9PLEO|nr:GPI ethanolamine phosphate transferase-like protein 2 [Dendryphion nanum]